jgi:uncharacterized membrane protein (DUF373 family)
VSDPEPDSPKPVSPAQRVEGWLRPWLAGADAVVYVLVGRVFLVAAAVMLAYSVLTFPGNVGRDGVPLATITLVNDLLLVMIIMEVLRTVLSYLEERGTSLRPFLFIAAISVTRRVLAIGAQMSVTGETLSAEQFQRAMIDLAVNAGAILAIALALFLLGRRGAADG